MRYRKKATASFNCSHRQCCCQMGLTDSRRAKEQNVLITFCEYQCAKFIDLISVNARLKVKIEFFKCLVERQLGQFEPRLLAPTFSCLFLLDQQLMQEPEIRHVFIPRCIIQFGIQQSRCCSHPHL
ncbi:MAG: hypothetical protein PUC26_01960 [Eubacteriales bacterium]|nr:hypothetical protein [Eubacteriales bacterium]